MMSSPPSPPPSPPSRKRQRSNSTLSDTSVKRSLSDGPSQDSEPLSTLSLSDSTDTYMAELETDTIRLAPQGSFLPPAERYARVEGLKQERLNQGDTWYLVDRTWWKRWKKACTGIVDKEGPVSEDQLGPVDNAPLVDASGNLRAPLSDMVDYELVPQAGWDDLVSWYGEPKHPLPRQVILRGEQKEPSVELYPLRLIVMRMVQMIISTAPSQPPQSLSISCSATVSDLNKALASSVRRPGAPEKTPYRVWKVNAPPPAGFESVDFLYENFSTYECENIDGTSKTLEETGFMQGDAFVVEFRMGKWIADPPPTARPPPLEAAPSITETPMFPSGGGFFDRLNGGNQQTSSTRPFGSSLSRSPVINPTPSTSKTLEPGTLGLGNMGNTCFMNSALQCLAHQPELVDYFLSGVFSKELNPDNPLGMHGAIAEAFGALLQRIWAATAPSTSYAPRDFKTQLQRFAPQFSGYQQHDSQELVAFLLDGLHEDLNRVLQKPYVEKPDWEGGGDRELVDLARRSWEGYMKRNDSVIVDLFQGQYQSTLVCPECEKVSITFDPFMYLTLPLPVQKKWKHTIFYVPWDTDKPHVKIPVEIGRDASFKDLRHLLGRWMGVPPDNLLTLETFSQKFYKNLDDTLLCGEMSPNDHIVCYELPCHAQQSRTYKAQPGDPLILPLYLTDFRPTPATPQRTTYGTYGGYHSNPTYFGHPMIVVLSPEQVADKDAIYDQVVKRLERWVNHPRELFRWEVPGAIQINGVPPVVDSLVEIKANGDVVEHIEAPEGDITDEKGLIVEDEDVAMEGVVNGDGDREPVCVGSKPDLFMLKVLPKMKEYGTANSYLTVNKSETLEARAETAVDGLLLEDGDLLVCEFEENMRHFYFGDGIHRLGEDTRGESWGQMVHPEYEEAQRAAESKKNQGISLQDCLDEFTKQEQLGEDDLWYCPRCKKHQQATKKFDLWKAPDVLVVHLKRFSNSRTLRDKIDAFVDFPVAGLDLGEMVGERAAARRLAEQGESLDGLELGNMDEPLIYDLFGVDEHMGGLGGGHYRAYALNHRNDKWYHFDDSYVTPAKADDAVNANAYLLFYRRRSTEPLGGKTRAKIDAAQLERQQEPEEITLEESSISIIDARDDDLGLPQLTSFERSAGGSSPSSMHEEPPDLEDPIDIQLDPLMQSNQRFDFPDPSSNKASPASSTEADGDGEAWGTPYSLGSPSQWSPQRSPNTLDRLHSPSENSSASDTNPFTDGHIENTSMHLKVD